MSRFPHWVHTHSIKIYTLNNKSPHSFEKQLNTEFICFHIMLKSYVNFVIIYFEIINRQHMFKLNSLAFNININFLILINIRYTKFVYIIHLKFVPNLSSVLSSASVIMHQETVNKIIFHRTCCLITEQFEIYFLLGVTKSFLSA